jgi:LysR family hydrogen peroxide-inducible transcriptional activator
MTIRQLEYIIALDNYRQFVSAAAHCHVSQPTLSVQVKKLEDEIGVQIFDRFKAPIEPTIAGEQIILKARQILREIEQLQAFVSSETELTEGTFTLGVIPTLAPYLLPVFLPAFVKENPNIHLIIQELQTDQIITQLEKGMIDLGLLVTPLEEKAIREIALFNEPFLLYLNKDHPLYQTKNVSPTLIDTEGLLVLEEGHCFRDQALEICKRRTKKTTIGFEYESGSIEALKGLVRQGFGYTLVPELSVIDELESGGVIRFSQPEPIREVSIVVHHSFTKEGLIEKLRASILKSIPERFNQIRHFQKVRWR